MGLYGYMKIHQINADQKLQNELSKPERILQEEKFAEKHRNDTDEELIEYVVQKRLKMGKAHFKRYNVIGYNYLVERFGSWCEMISRVNIRIKEIRGEQKKE